jgi:hypothetical protein
MAGHGRWWTVVLNPEKRKVGGSTPPLTATSDQPKRLGQGGGLGILGWRSLSFRPRRSRRSALPSEYRGWSQGQ